MQSSTSQKTCIHELAQKMNELQKFRGNMWVRIGEEVLEELEITFDRNKHPVPENPDFHFVHVYWRFAPGDGKGKIDDSMGNRHADSTNLLDGFSKAAELIKKNAEPLIQTLSVHADGRQIPTSDFLYETCRLAFCELFGLEPTVVPKNLEAYKERQSIQESLLMTLFNRGTDGLKAWASTYRRQVKLVQLVGLSFEEKVLDGFDFSHLSLERCNFSNSSLKGANFSGSQLSKSKFTNSNLEGACFQLADASGVDFSNSKMQSCRLSGASLRNTQFKNSDLSNAELNESDLIGADLSDCTLLGAKLTKAKYDDKTKLPSDLPQWRTLKWKGKGLDPFKQSIKQEATAIGTIDASELVPQLKTIVDKSRIDKAISMLKKERFQLFSDTTNDSLLGVVRSQTDLELVYACRLTASGEYCCCTQNLNACGGLRGALCKHLIVLLIGLTKAGQISATDAAKWALASGIEKPKIDRDAMTEVFIKYQCAEAGEIDWRPTETIPEDYYAF